MFTNLEVHDDLNFGHAFVAPVQLVFTINCRKVVDLRLLARDELVYKALRRVGIEAQVNAVKKESSLLFGIAISTIIGLNSVPTVLSKDS